MVTSCTEAVECFCWSERMVRAMTRAMMHFERRDDAVARVVVDAVSDGLAGAQPQDGRRDEHGLRRRLVQRVLHGARRAQTCWTLVWGQLRLSRCRTLIYPHRRLVLTKSDSTRVLNALVCSRS